MSVAVPQLPDPTSYRFAQMLMATPWSSHCLHTAIAFPLPFTDRPGPWASWVEESTRVAVPQPDPTTYRFAQMCLELLASPNAWYHATIAFPLLSNPTCGNEANPGLSSIKVAVPQLPDPTSYRFAQMLGFGSTPSDCLHTAIAFPLLSIATQVSLASWELLSMRVGRAPAV